MRRLSRGFVLPAFLCGGLLLGVAFGAQVSPFVSPVSAQESCDVVVNLIADGGFDYPTLDGPNTIPFPDDSAWSGGFLTNTFDSNGQSAVAYGANSFSQTIDTTGLDGVTLTISFDSATGGTMTIGTQSENLPWNAGSWGTYSTAYTVGAGETSVLLSFSAPESQINIDNVAVTYLSNPCPTPTTEPEPTATDEPMLTPTTEPTATDEPVLTPTTEPTATDEPVLTPTIEPTSDIATDTPATTVTLIPTLANNPTTPPTPESTKSTTTVSALPNTGTGESDSNTPLLYSALGSLTLAIGSSTIIWRRRTP